MDELLYERLATDVTLASLTGGRINPDAAEADSALAGLYYVRLATEDVVGLSGPSGLKMVSYAIDVIDDDFDTVRLIQDAVYARLSTWRDASVRGCFMETSLTVQEDRSYHGQQTWNIWVKN